VPRSSLRALGNLRASRRHARQSGSAGTLHQRSEGQRGGVTALCRNCVHIRVKGVPEQRRITETRGWLGQPRGGLIKTNPASPFAPLPRAPSINDGSDILERISSHGIDLWRIILVESCEREKEGDRETRWEKLISVEKRWKGASDVTGCEIDFIARKLLAFPQRRPNPDNLKAFEASLIGWSLIINELTR